MTQVDGAVYIQRVFRGFLDRKVYYQLLLEYSYKLYLEDVKNGIYQ